MLKKILLTVAAVLVLIQFIRPDKTNPPVDPAKDFVQLVQAPEDIRALLATSCYDCHSNETKYPWYTDIAPVSWWMKHHINEGREHLNFSEWGDYNEKRRDHKLEECVEEVSEGEMPLSSYTLMHGKAKLSAEQQKKLAGWFEEMRKNSDQ